MLVRSISFSGNIRSGRGLLPCPSASAAIVRPDSAAAVDRSKRSSLRYMAGGFATNHLTGACLRARVTPDLIVC